MASNDATMANKERLEGQPLPGSVPGHVDLESPAAPDSGIIDEAAAGSVPWSELYKGTPFSPKSLFPPLTWVPRYIRSIKGETTPEDVRYLGNLPNSVQGDVIAGLTVGIMLVPQCLAFALLAGLPVQVGLFSSFAPLIVYSLFGTMRQVQTGPTALMSLLTGQALDSMDILDKEMRIKGACLLALFVGILSFVLGVLRFGGIVDFMSHTVMSAFCTASGIIIATSQLKDMFGVSFARTHYWWETVEELFDAVEDIHGATTALSFSILVMLLFLKFWKTAGSKEKREKHFLWRFMPKEKSSVPFKALKLLADLSSFLAVFVGSMIAWALREGGVEGIKLVGEVNADGFIFVMPGNGVFKELTSDSTLFVSAVVISTIGFLETVAVGGKFAAQYRYDFDPNQDMIGLGLANVASAFMSGFPVTGGFSRTAVNVSFGATSLFTNAIASVLVLGSMYALRSAIENIPRACMAPIIIQGALAVIDLHEFKATLAARPLEFVVMLATFVVSLCLTVKEGLAVGFVLSIFKTLMDISSPNMAVVARVGDNWRDVRHFPNGEQPKNAIVVRIDARLHFANSRKLKEFCLAAIKIREESGDKIDYLVLDGKAINGIDMTSCEMLVVLGEALSGRKQHLVLANLKAPIVASLEAAGLVKSIKKAGGHLALDVQHALALISQPDPDWADEEQKVQSLLESSKALYDTTGRRLMKMGKAS
mmetsp:Transcript_15392/g.33313  ORF Transcript_15392/g.33313 Transcript_15392/m.33313 type:complete len:709 (+) Transcript_15392:139-2265(+)